MEEKNIDFEIGSFLLIGGIFGSTVGIIIFNFERIGKFRSNNKHIVCNFLGNNRNINAN